MREELMADNLYLGYENPSNGARPINPFSQLKNTNMSQDWMRVFGNGINAAMPTIPTGNLTEYAAKLLGGLSPEVDRQRSRNANNIAEDNYQNAANRFTGNALNTNSRQEATDNDLNQMIQALGSFFGNSSQPQNSNLSANEIMDINRAGVRDSSQAAREGLFARAGVDEKTDYRLAGIDKDKDFRMQQFNIQNANVNAAIQKARDKLGSALNMQEGMQSELFNLNKMNQEFENSKGLNQQQMRDNENQRKYSLAESTLGNISNIYQAGMPKNLLAGMLG